VAVKHGTVVPLTESVTVQGAATLFQWDSELA
jgi:hypothetical protein